MGNSPGSDTERSATARMVVVAARMRTDAVVARDLTDSRTDAEEAVGCKADADSHTVAVAETGRRQIAEERIEHWSSSLLNSHRKGHPSVHWWLAH